ncbi:hypothetical protein ACFQL7_09185 [Halocatena marina]|uniref:Transposase n=1 Tax=Halocatena marina TaxID=2934937 RepID=A0ABD5YLC2_9EURY
MIEGVAMNSDTTARALVDTFENWHTGHCSIIRNNEGHNRSML